MKAILSVVMAAGLVLIPLAMNGQAQQPKNPAPPVAQPLVREGELAVKLAEKLKIGASASEAEAEDALASAGIAPKNGWIADYPVTPDIIGELQDSISKAADSKGLGMSRDEALNTFQNLSSEMALSIAPDTRGQVAQNDPPGDYGETYGESYQPEVIDNYYYNEGPPVVTYYPPPWDYSYMYAWVPYPFWWTGVWFPGFFVLHDFHRPIFVHGRHCFVSNHFRDPGTHRFHTIDPVTRHTGRGFGADFDGSRHRGFQSTDARRGAASIYERSRESRGYANGPGGRGSMPSRPGTRFEGRTPTNRSDSSSSPRIRGGASERPSTDGQWRGRSPGEPGSRGPSGRTFQQRGIEGRGAPNFNSPAGRINRSSRSPSIGSSRSFSPPSRGAGRSFSSPSAGSRGFSGGSFRAPQGGGRGGGFGRGGSSPRS